MFEKISEKLKDAIKSLRGLNTVSEKNIAGALRDVRDAFLDADVTFDVIRAFLEDVRQKAIGEKVIRAISPGQQLIKIINDAMIDLFGRETKFCEDKPLRVLLLGLNGSGKTTSAIKLAKWLQRKKYTPLLVACDLQRPAAIDQLEQMANAESLKCYVERGARSAISVAKKANKYADEIGADAIIFDTAGRLQVDASLMRELSAMQEEVCAQEVLLITDAALGQESVNVAKTFHEAVQLTGVVMTKMDGDARGGAALSMKHSTGVQIKFIGTGETVDDWDIFHADGMVQRILGMGDVVSLVERANERVDKQEAERLSKRFKKAEFDFDDYLSQMEQIGKMGPVGSLVKMLPGMGNATISPRELSLIDQNKAIIRAMTKEERRRPQIINGSRKLRIARGTGVELKDINHLLKQFESIKKAMKKFKTPQGKKMFAQMTAQSTLGQVSKLFDR